MSRSGSCNYCGFTPSSGTQEYKCNECGQRFCTSCMTSRGCPGCGGESYMQWEWIQN